MPRMLELASGRWARIAFVLALIVSVFIVPAAMRVSATGTNCVTTNTGTYTITPCITAPLDGATISGAVTVSADNGSPTGANPGIAKYIFYLTPINQPTPQYLLTDYVSPYSFTLPSNKFVDGTYSLAVVALMKDGTTSNPSSSITITLNNGVTTQPAPQNTFAPTTGTTPPAGQPFTVVTTGDGADGATNSGNVTNLINSWNPNLFLYVGDVYEKGTATEFYNWYGQANAFYGRFKPITDPVIGNHEYENGVAPGYHDYWNLGANAPTYYSYDAAGWHFIALNSNCGLLQDCTVGKAQYNWLLNDLNTHSNICTIAYFHHPVLNVGYEGYATSMNDMWALMAQHGVDIVLNGHDHDYQRWMPLDGNLNPSPSGMTEFVAGGGGHGIQTFKGTDPRMAIGYDTSPYTFGALRLQLNSNGAGFQYINWQGMVLDSGAIPCNGAPADTTAPSTPTSLTATTHSASQADLSWGGSTDNVGIAGYDIYRNGTLLTSVGYVTSYSDTNLTMGTTYNYQVTARDAAGNTSAFSNMAAVTMPSVLFSDGFESGDFTAWTANTNVQITTQEHYAGTHAAQATSNGSAASFISKALTTSQSDLYYSLRFKINSKSSSTSAYIQRFRAGSTGGTALGGVLVSSTNKLGYRNDVAATSNTNGPPVTIGYWHEVQTHLHIDTSDPGANGQIQIWYDGALAFSATENFGTNRISRIYAGDSSTSGIFDEVIDDVALNTSFIDTTDSQSPSTPTGLTANATAPNSVNLAWNAATDNISVTGYDLYRNSALVATLGAVTNYIDTSVSPNFAYQYQVRARDAAGNISGLSNTVSATTPADTTTPSVTLTAPDDGVFVNANVVLSADATDNVDVEDVDFLINGNVVGTVGEGGPYRFIWDSTTTPDGPVTFTARAVDTSGNATTSSSRTINVYNAAGDTTPPSTPANFTATAGGGSRADLAWKASTDNVGVVAYDIYRDGTLLTSVGAVTSYSDSSVVIGATYQYQVLARDAAGNVSAPTSSATVTIPALLFSDGFESGNLSGWTNQGLAVQQQTVLEGAYAAEANSTGPASWAYALLGTAKNDLYSRTWFKIISKGANNVNLLRFRSGTTGTGGAILGVFVSSTGKLGTTNDAGGGSTTSTTSVNSGVWHSLQTHANITTGQVEVWLDGAPVSALNQTLNLGATAVRRLQLGESTTGRTYDVAFDQVAYDTSLIQSSYTMIDSGPLGTVSTTAASFSFSSTTAGATFECSLDASAFSACTSPQAYSGLTDGAHTFAVRAIDALNNVDPTPATRTWTVDTTAPTVTTVSPVDAAIEVPITTNASVTFSEAMNASAFTTSNFTLVLQGDTTPIPATVTYDVATKTATLQPASPLAYSTTYVATVKGGVDGATDVVGNPLAADMVWSFTTFAPDTTAPVVTLTAPADGATVSGSVTFSADATDNVAVDHVDFLVKGALVGTDSSSPYSVSWDTTTGANGAMVITAQAVDSSANATISTASNVTVANDVTPPSAPTILAASTPSSGQADLSWTAATDDVGVTGYDIYRDGTLLTSVGVVTSYSDTTTDPATTYQYQVRARDAVGHVSTLSSPATVTTPAALFSDGFESGDLSSWTTVNGLVVQQQQVHSGVYGARATTGGPAANANKLFSTAQYELYYSTWFNIQSLDPVNSVYLQRFIKADTFSALGVFVSKTGRLGYRNDISQGSNTNGPSVSLNAWHQVKTHVRIDAAGGPGQVDVWFDGAPVAALSQAESLGNAPIARIQLGDSTTGRSYDIAFDDVTATTPADTTPPTVTLTAPSSGATISGTVTLAASASDNIAVDHVDFLVNGNMVGSDSTAPYSISWDSATTADGAATIAARAVDTANNAATSAGASVTIDNTPPETTLTTPASGATVGGSVTLAASASDNIAVDHVDFLVNGNMVGSDSTAPYSFDWNSAATADGARTITAQAADIAGNTTTSVGVNVTLDNTPPDTTITAAPASLIITSTVSLSFSASPTEAGATFECSLDNAAFSACTSPKGYTGLAEGAHTFDVKAIDSVGNADATPASRTWTVDTIAPTIMSVVPADGATNVAATTNVTVTFGEAMDPATLTNATFFLRTKQGNNPVAATVSYNSSMKQAIFHPTASLASNTQYRATVKGGVSGAKDLAGNALGVDYIWLFTTGQADTTPPTGVAITAPANGASVAGNVTLSATASDNVAVARVDFLVNNNVVGSDTTSPYSISWNSATFTDGSAAIVARAFDTSNNQTTSASRTVTLDNTPPDTTITAGPSGTVTSTSASFSFTATEIGSTFACSLDGAAFSACSSPQNYTGLANGSHTFQVRATDATGNVDATPASRTWTIDTVAPDTTITAGPSGSVNSTSASFSFSATEAGSTFECKLDSASFAACTSPQSYTGLANGSHTFQVRAKDTATNVDATPASSTWTVDTAAPTGVSITTPANNANVSGQVTISAAASDNVGVAGVRFYLDGNLLNTDTTAPYSITWNSKQSSKGQHTLYVIAYDAAGNTTQSTSITVTVV